MKTRQRLFILILMIIALTGCGGNSFKASDMLDWINVTKMVPEVLKPAPAPTRVEMSMEAAPDLNPDPSGRPSPLLLRLYELKTPSQFTRTDFFTLYDQDTTVLATDLLAREELLVKPGETYQLERELSEETRHLGWLAAYRDLDRAVWRATLPIPPNQTTPIEIKLTNTAITVRVADN